MKKQMLYSKSSNVPCTVPQKRKVTQILYIFGFFTLFVSLVEDVLYTVRRSHLFGVRSLLKKHEQ